MENVTADAHRVPGCVAVVVDERGKTVFQHANRVRNIAAMQLVEQGVLALDDTELEPDRILKGFDDDGKTTLVPTKKSGTLRMLWITLLNLNGSSSVREFVFGSLDEVADGHASDILSKPPSSSSVKTGWAGTLIERVSDMALNSYFQTCIFAPLSQHLIFMFSTPRMAAQSAHVHQKTPQDGGSKVRARDHCYQATREMRASRVSSTRKAPGFVYGERGLSVFEPDSRIP